MITRKQLPNITSPVAVALLNTSPEAICSRTAVQQLEEEVLPGWGRGTGFAPLQIAQHQQMAAHMVPYIKRQSAASGTAEVLIINTSGSVQKREETTTHDWRALKPVTTGDLSLFQTAKGSVLQGTIVGDPICQVCYLSFIDVPSLCLQCATLAVCHGV